METADTVLILMGIGLIVSTATALFLGLFVASTNRDLAELRGDLRDWRREFKEDLRDLRDTR